MRTTWAAVIVVTWAGVARAQLPDLSDLPDRDVRTAPAEARTSAAGDVATGPPDPAAIPWGFYRDKKRRLMQISFDLTRRAYLGTAWAPLRLPTGAVELGPAAFDFGAQYELLSADGLTRYRWHFMEGEARVHPYGLDVTAVRFDLSPHWILKFEGHFLRGTAALSSALNDNRPLSDLVNQWWLVAAKTTVYF